MPDRRARLVFTHGATMDHGMFDSQMAYFAADRTVISWDVPAHGASRPYDGFSLRNASEDLAALLDQEGAETAHLVGQSMGGYISQIFAYEFPLRVRSLCAVDSSPLKSDYYSGLDRRLLSITPSLLALYPYQTLVRLIAKQVSLSDHGRQYAERVLRQLTKAEIRAIMAAVYDGLVEYAKRDVAIACPVLLIVGANDRSGKVMSYCRRWSEEEGHPLVIVPEAAHNANVDNPEAVNGHLRDFVDRVEAENA